MDTKEHNGRTYLLVEEDHPYMLAAAKAREECAGDHLFPVGIVMVKDGEVVARAGNGYNGKRDGTHICPRIVRNSPSGEDYHLCDFHQPEGHAEPMVVEAAKKAGVDTQGADVYMYGHWWACEPCWWVLEEAGVENVYLLEDAKKRFENVRDEATQLTIESVYVAGALTRLTDKDRKRQLALYESLAEICENIGCEAYVPHLHTGPESNPDASPQEVHRIGVEQVKVHDVTLAEVSYPSLGVGGELMVADQAQKPIILLSRKGEKVSRFATGNPSAVYHLRYDSVEEVREKLPRILKQL